MSLKDKHAILFFSEAHDLEPGEIGGKGYGLAQMTKLGIPVPPGFIISIQAARHPYDIKSYLNRALSQLEKISKTKLGDPKRPLFVSVRSGAPVSMPGMMDTILNLGLNKDVLPTLASLTNHKFANSTLANFRRELTTEDLEEQIFFAVESVASSWDSKRAQQYRQANAISRNQGTAVIIQKMVFGNYPKRSGTGVVFSRNTKTGNPELWGEYLPGSQGEKLVSGSETPEPLEFLQNTEPKIYQQLQRYVKRLEHHFQNVVDVEFTIEDGKLWLLQVREAKCAPSAIARIMVDLVKEGTINKREALEKIGPLTLTSLKHPKIVADPKMLKKATQTNLLAQGISAADGFASGKAVFTSKRAVELSQKGKPVILVRPETNADDIEGILSANAIVTIKGGHTCHAAVVARSLGKPSVVGADDLDLLITGDAYRGLRGLELKEGDHISVDGSSGFVILGEVASHENGIDPNVKSILEWEKRNAQLPTINFNLLEGSFSANQILADFYTADRLACELVGTDLEIEARDLSHRIQTNAAQVFATYLLVAISGEARHAYNRTDKRRGNRAVLLGRLILAIGFSDQNDSRSAIQERVVTKLRGSSTTRIIKFVELCRQVFSRLKWDTAMGGKSWAEIANALELYLKGRWGVTTFVDRVFNLRHNNGLAFDKHQMLYSKTYDGYLEKQLDQKRNAINLDQLIRGITSVKDEVSLSPEVEQLLDKAMELKGVKNAR